MKKGELIKMKNNILLKAIACALSVVWIPCILVVGDILPKCQHLLPYCENVLTVIECFYWFSCFIGVAFLLIVRTGFNLEDCRKAVDQIKNDASKLLNKITSINSIVALILVAIIIGDISFILSIIIFKTLVYQIKNTEIKVTGGKNG